jgi:hypothetical protein
LAPGYKYSCPKPKLQARLDGFIDNPSAETILHHLFPSLAFIVDECYDLFDEDLVHDVVTPLLTARDRFHEA